MSGEAYWQNLSSAELAERGKSGAVAILPVAATEQHGPHLPTGTDAFINAGIIDAAVGRMVDGLQPVILPMVQVGKSNEHLSYAGTLSHSAEALIRQWTELGECVHQTGFRKLLFFNSHGGQSSLCEIVSLDLRQRLGLVTGWSSWSALGLPDNVIDEHERVYGIHGGEIETSMMLYLHPKLVQMDKAENFTSQAEKISQQCTHLTTGRRVGLGWMTEDLNPDGAMGNAAVATAETGKKLVDHAAGALLKLIEDMQNYDIPA